MNQASLVLILAFVLGALLPFAVRPLLHALNMVDIPNERSSHTIPTYRGMGLATASATCLSFAVATLMGWTVNLPISLTFLAGGGLALLLGWTEDVYGVSVAKRAGMQLVIGLGIALSLAIIQEASLLWVPVAGIFIAGYINVTNFMDGINGISGCHGLVAGLAYAYMGGVSSLPIVWAFVLFASDLFLTGAFFAGVGVLALAVAVIVLYLRLPELLDTRLQPAEQGHSNSKQNIADLNTETHPMSERKSEGSQE